MARSLTGAERQSAFRLSGRQVSVVLRDPAAIRALDDLVKETGGVAAAVAFALKNVGHHAVRNAGAQARGSKKA